MKIEDPVAALENANNLNALEQSAKELETANSRIIELENINNALETENIELKMRLEIVNDEIHSLTEDNNRLTDCKKVLQTTLETANKQIGELTANNTSLSDMFEEAVEQAADIEETKTAVQDQLGIIARHLNPKGEIPGLICAGGELTNALYLQWFELSRSGNSLDKQKARQIYMTNKAEIDAAIIEKNVVSEHKVTVPVCSEEDRAITERWNKLRLAAAEAQARNTMAQTIERHRDYVEKSVEARKFYNQNRASIDRALAASV